MAFLAPLHLRAFAFKMPPGLTGTNQLDGKLNRLIWKQRGQPMNTTIR
jgi:hypothetical protein